MENNETAARAKVEISELKARIAELERQLAETKQLLAMAEGEPEGGLPGWRMLNLSEFDDPAEWRYGGPWAQGVPEAVVFRSYADEGGCWLDSYPGDGDVGVVMAHESGYPRMVVGEVRSDGLTFAGWRNVVEIIGFPPDFDKCWVDLLSDGRP